MSESKIKILCDDVKAINEIKKIISNLIESYIKLFIILYFLYIK